MRRVFFPRSVQVFFAPTNKLEMPLKKAYKYTSKVMTENMMALDAREGISAFLEKRKPNWQNK